MKLLVLSDLHLEFSDMQKPTAEADVVVLAGDVWQGDRGIYWARENWPKTEIVYVSGNHEFYGKDRKNVLAMLRIAAQKSGVHFLENDQVIIDGVRFLGCTLWTNFKLFGEELKQLCMLEGRSYLNDFRVITNGEKNFSPEDSIDLHDESVAWLNKKLKAEQFTGKTVVVTHHLPSRLSVAERYLNSHLSACFASNLDELFGLGDLWVHGHTHDSFDYQGLQPSTHSYREVKNADSEGLVNPKGTRVVCNPRGYCSYPGGEENFNFNPNFIVEI